MSDTKIVQTIELECSGDCGAKIALSYSGGGKQDDTDAVAEFLGWATVDVGKKDLAVYCPRCVERAHLIVGIAHTKAQRRRSCSTRS